MEEKHETFKAAVKDKDSAIKIELDETKTRASFPCTVFHRVL